MTGPALEVRAATVADRGALVRLMTAHLGERGMVPDPAGVERAV